MDAAWFRPSRAWMWLLPLLAGSAGAPLLAGPAGAVTVNDAGRPAASGNGVPSCYVLSDVAVTDRGRVRLGFTRRSGRKFDWATVFCEKRVYHAETSPPGLIAATGGLEDPSDKGGFHIDVEAPTRSITLELAGLERKLAQRVFDVARYVPTAQRASTDWRRNLGSRAPVPNRSAGNGGTPPEIALDGPAGGGDEIRVETYRIAIAGRVRDAGGVYSLALNGKTVAMDTDGRFSVKPRLALGRNEILFRAEDVDGNVTTRVVRVLRVASEIVEDLDDIDQPPATTLKRPHGIGVVIGIEDYRYVPAARFARNDAEIVREYLAQTLGYPRERLAIATDQRATGAELDRLLGRDGWLARNIVAGTSDVVVYFAGHGLPDPISKQVYLLPHDVDPNYARGLALDRLYEDLSRLGARSVTVFLDACFTGQTRERQLLIADARPIVVAARPGAPPGTLTVLTATARGETSGALAERQHGLFTYSLLDGLRGKADGNGDSRITVDELAGFVARDVKTRAAKRGRAQSPQFYPGASAAMVLR